MILDGDALSDSDVGVLARMHLMALPQSLVAVLGERYAGAFYRYLAHSRDEIILLERGGESGLDILGACLVSACPETLHRRLALRTPLLLYGLLSLTRLPLRSMVKQMFAGAASAPVRQPEGPEIILIFTRQAIRGQGLGTRLIGRTEAWLRSLGAERLLVKTQDRLDNQAIRFYEKLGFRRIGSIVDLGKSLLLFEKLIRPENDAGIMLFQAGN